MSVELQTFGQGFSGREGEDYISRLVVWKKEPHPEGLRLLDVDLSLLIPSRLLELVSDPARVIVVRLPNALGRLDNEYFPKLSVVVVEKDAYDESRSIQDEDKKWSFIINNRRRDAIERGLISDRDRALISFIADDSFNPRGVEVKSLILERDIRGRGIGSEFYANVEEIVRSLGYKYIYGDNDISNFEFFLNTGRNLVAKLGVTKGLVPEPRMYTTIKFLDPKFEAEHTG